MTRTKKLAATVFLGCSVALAATACGSENTTSSGPDTSTTVGVTAPSETADVPVVGGPKPKTPASDRTIPETAEGSGQMCGATSGPDGALQIRIVAGDLPCDTAKTIAKEYGPLIATGAPQTVSGWDCAPSKVTGELSRCTKGSQSFALTP